MDDIKAIRDALAAGPTTPGPWRWTSRNFQCVLVGAEDREIIEANGVDGTDADDALIAACHPERIARLLDALAMAQKDAERYRWLRSEDSTGRVGEFWKMACLDYALTLEPLDAAIDAAMSSAPQSPAAAQSKP